MLQLYVELSMVTALFTDQQGARPSPEPFGHVPQRSFSQDHYPFPLLECNRHCRLRSSAQHHKAARGQPAQLSLQ